MTGVPSALSWNDRHVLVQHRVAEAIDGVGELGVIAGSRWMSVLPNRWMVGDDLARELLEHQVLVLGLGAELGGLEQPLAVPFVVLDAVGQIGSRQHPVQGERRVAVVELGRGSGP